MLVLVQIGLKLRPIITWASSWDPLWDWQTKRIIYRYTKVYTDIYVQDAGAPHSSSLTCSALQLLLTLNYDVMRFKCTRGKTTAGDKAVLKTLFSTSCCQSVSLYERLLLCFCKYPFDCIILCTSHMSSRLFLTTTVLHSSLNFFFILTTYLSHFYYYLNSIDIDIRINLYRPNFLVVTA